jgi:hypothetical protein
MKITRALAAAAALALIAAPAAMAQNADPNARAHFLSPIKVVGKQAKLKVRYRCSSGEALWVSAKQAKSRKRDPEIKKEGSSKVSAAWWQSHRNTFTCDGQYHTAKFSIDKVEPGSKGRLKKGRAWVQFCVTEGEETLILSKSGWVKVKRGKPAGY